MVKDKTIKEGVISVAFWVKVLFLVVSIKALSSQRKNSVFSLRSAYFWLWFAVSGGGFWAIRTLDTVTQL